MLRPLRFAVKYQPPVIVMEYERPDEDGADPYTLTRRLFDAHPRHLSPQWVKFEQVENLVSRILAAPRHEPAAEAGPEVEAGAKAELEPQPQPSAGQAGVNYNVLDDDALQEVKAGMEAEFEAKRLKPGDPGFEYDVRAEFDEADEPCEWDDLLGEDEPEAETEAELQPQPSASQAGVNYNVLDDDALQEVKAGMEAEFEAKRLKPGDPGFEYDVRAEFDEADEPCEWDDLLGEDEPEAEVDAEQEATTSSRAAQPIKYEAEEFEADSSSSSSSDSDADSSSASEIESIPEELYSYDDDGGVLF
ncbi:uncharacterized protein AMSG_07945 [Thecamonas trahens ATCC 50062]|uniref:Centrosomal protein of 19 kDa n=1 Tax=Thecamonas trahens ATCC 50062 TaxID=461836 RepID=A0A0L0DKG2_THETB|nr:hypothetical protein AMSG_07945 [Thecamonas trahens ATCC 50062]KNC51853.1 hypothetical protein AMSG_07945 [Thecamonas trahens ATCC 50062]|eukprot:XP_013755714.1 hypothetical protein AMSG_07945 [Thecamonas trahens ATCC 50062]